jgi:hypothetical protein
MDAREGPGRGAGQPAGPRQERAAWVNRGSRRRWPAAEWIIGEGHYASVASCDVTTVMLFRTQAETGHAKTLTDKLGCGRACIREHEITDLDKTGQAS